MSLINDIRNLKAKVARKKKEKLLDKQVARKQLFDCQIDDTINLISDTVSTVFNQLDKIRENQTHRFLSNFVGTYEACYPNEILDMDKESDEHYGRYNKNVENPFNTAFCE